MPRLAFAIWERKNKTMAKKVLNHKVEFSANGKSLTFRFSNDEVAALIAYSKSLCGNGKSGFLYNFSAFALFDYDIKGSKCARFNKNFNYHEFETMIWTIIED